MSYSLFDARKTGYSYLLISEPIYKVGLILNENYCSIRFLSNCPEPLYCIVLCSSFLTVAMPQPHASDTQWDHNQAGRLIRKYILHWLLPACQGYVCLALSLALSPVGLEASNQPALVARELRLALCFRYDVSVCVCVGCVCEREGDLNKCVHACWCMCV